MNRKYRIYRQRMMIAALLPLWAACTTDSITPDGETDPSGNTLQLLSVLMEETGTPRSIVTGETLQQLRLYATDQTDKHETYKGAEGSSSDGSADYIRSGSSWRQTGTKKIIIDTSTPPAIHAFSPNDLTVTNTGYDSHTIPVTVLTADDFSIGKQTDYLYATPVWLGAGEKVVTLSMHHALAKVSLQISKATTIAESETMTVTQVEIISKSNALKSGTGKMSLDNGGIEELAGTPVLTLADATGSNLVYTPDAPTASALVAPVTLPANDLSFRITLSGHDTPFVTAPVSTGQTWEQGVHYLYTVTLSKTEAAFQSVSMYDWQSDASQNTNIGI